MKKLLLLSLVLPFLLSNCASEGLFSLDGSSSAGQSGSITRFAVHNGYMYALNSNEVLTYSLEQPDQPKIVHTLPTDYGLETIIIYDNTIYLGSRTALYILGIDNPAAPVILSKSERGIAFFGGCDPVVVKGNYAYSTVKIIENICGTAASQSALLVYDVTNKNNPKLVGTHFLFEPNGLGYKDDYLFVCDAGFNQVLVFDISDPLNVRNLEDYNLSIGAPYDLIVDDNRMLVSTATDFQIYDITDIANIRQTGYISK